MAVDAVVLAAALALTDQAAPKVPPPPERTAANVEAEMGNAADPLTLEIAYTADILSSVSGGRRRGTRYVDNLDVIASADLDALAGIPRTTATIHAFHNNGGSFSGSLVGDAQVISGIETGTRITRLYQAWIEHRGKGDRWSLKLGLYDINSEFDVLAASLLFVHSAHGMGTDFAQSGRNGPSTYPSTSLGIRGEWRVSDRLRVRAAILDGTPNDPDRPRRMRIRLGNGEGALAIAEADATFGAVRLIAGGWGYTAATRNRFDAESGAPVVRRAHSKGAYVRGEAQLAGTEERGLRGFFRLGVADGRVNPFSSFYSGGFTWRGLIAARPGDETGVALAYAAASGTSRRLSRAAIGEADRGEMVLELTHRIKLTDWLSAQPDMQYVVNPGLDPSLKNALAIGARLTANLAL